jgi:predicted acyltransferase
MTIALMIIVNNPGSWSYVYPPLKHASWNGCTPTDLVFPFFLFIVGMSMWLSFKKYRAGTHVLSTTAVQKILKRVSIIFLLGLFLNMFPFINFENARIFGVLQRIALAYGLAATFSIFFNLRNLKLIFAVLLLGYWLLLLLGGSGNAFGLEDNLVRTVDLYVLGENHMYHGYGIPFDPEGLLSTIPAVGTVLMGYFGGNLIDSSKNKVVLIKKLTLVGIIAVTLGLIWGIWFPINKPIWTSSYVLYTGGIALVFMAFLTWLIDYKGIKKWATPFIHFGTNPLFIYVFAGVYISTILSLIQLKNSEGDELSGYAYLYQEVFVPLAGNMNGSLLFAIAHIVFFWSITYILYRRKIFIKI